MLCAWLSEWSRPRWGQRLPGLTERFSIVGWSTMTYSAATLAVLLLALALLNAATAPAPTVQESSKGEAA